MGDYADFSQIFLNLEGDLLSERKKNFYKLLKTISSQNEEELNNTLKKLKPKTYQENIFYIDALIYFKRTHQLLELLKSGNEIYASKILKQLWFFEEVFKDIVPEILVDEFLPYLSYAIRKKFLNKLVKCWKTERINLLFDALDKKYGLTVAIPILHKCTTAKIKSVLYDNEVNLRPNQVLELLNVSEDLFKLYLDHINNISHGKYDENKVLSYLARKNPKLYLELGKLKKIACQQLSKRNTKKIVPLIKEELLCDSEYHFRYLNKAVAVRKLGYEFEIIYKNIFPERFNDISSYSTSNRLLEYYPKKRRWNLFLQTCNLKFPDKTLNQILCLFSYHFKNMNPPNDIFLKWAEIHYQKQEGNYEDYLKYYEPSVSVPLIKDKINVTKEIYKRTNLIQLMIQSCSEHKDFAALEQVLQYVCFRHRNEDANFRSQILTKIGYNFKLEELNENHWKYINEQIKILRIQKEFNFYTNAHFLERYLEFLFKNKKDHKEALIEYIKELVPQRNMRALDLKNKPIEKEIYTEIGKIFLQALDKESEEFVENQYRILTTIINFSVNNPDYCININDLPDFAPLIKLAFTKTENFRSIDINLISKLFTYNLTFPKYAVPIEDSRILDITSLSIEKQKSFSSFSAMFHKFLLKENRTNLENSLLSLYFDKLLDVYPEMNIVNWFVKHEPSIVVPYFEKIVKSSLSTYNPLEFKILKLYSHLNFDQTVCKYYKTKLFDKDVDDKKRLVLALSVLLSTEDFQKIVEENYLPKKDKLDMEDKEMLALYKLQCDVVKMLADVPDPYKILPTIMKFCKGDYLQSTLKPLYKAFYRSPERVLYSYVESLSKMAVSVRKHAIFLSCEVLDKEHTLNILKNTSEGNVSSQKHLFSATLKYFLKNPSRDLLRKLIESMSYIDKNDTEALDSLKNVTVPLKYRSEYLENCWKFFESLESKGVKIKGYLEQLLYKMRGDILLSLSSDFITNILNDYLIKADRLSGTDDFVVAILKTRVSQRNALFNLVFDLLAKASLVNTTNFFNCFMSTFKEQDIDQSLALLFSEYWNKHFTITNFLNEHIELNLRLLRINGCSSDSYATGVVNYLEKLIAEFGFHVFYNFRRRFNEILCDTYNAEFYSILRGILKHKVDATTCMLVLQLLKPPNKEAMLTYNEIVTTLEKVDIPIVKANLINYLNTNVIEDLS